jgi:hypothetical protein
MSRESTMQEAMARLRAFVDADPDLTWIGGGWESVSPVHSAYDENGRTRHGFQSTTMNLRLLFTPHRVTAVEELKDAISNQ